MRKTIWTAWFQGEDEAPELVQQCFKSWRVKNPDWELHVLDYDSISEMKELSFLTPGLQKQIPKPALSDILRINLLRETGGIWVDATCLARVALQHWLPPLKVVDFFAFSQPTTDRAISTWFMAVQPHSMIVDIWCSHVKRIWSQEETPIILTHQEWAEFRQAHEGADAPPLWLREEFWEQPQGLPYFWFHYLFAYLLEADALFRKVWAAEPKISANIPHLFALNGYQNHMTDEVQATFLQGVAPLLKLTWRYDLDNPPDWVPFVMAEANW